MEEGEWKREQVVRTTAEATRSPGRTRKWNCRNVREDHRDSLRENWTGRSHAVETRSVDAKKEPMLVLNFAICVARGAPHRALAAADGEDAVSFEANEVLGSGSRHRAKATRPPRTAPRFPTARHKATRLAARGRLPIAHAT